jgi:hypothetical protein
MHVEDDVAAIVLLNLPPEHMVHDALPAGLKEPAGQAIAVRTVEPSGQAYPAGQGDSHESEPVALSATPTVPCGHNLQVAAPASLPAEHAKALALVDPA